MREQNFFFLFASFAVFARTNPFFLTNPKNPKMCIAVLAWQAHPRWQLVVAANRDEYHARPAAPLARWEKDDETGSGIIAGRDITGGGTWLGVHEAGRLVLVTNFRVEGYPQANRPSRGGLVTGLLTGDNPEKVPLAPYNPFNLFCADLSGARFLSNHPADERGLLMPGVHGLSNGSFHLPWPKTRALSAAMQTWLGGEAEDPTALLTPLANEKPIETDSQGPEPRLSGIFIRDPIYGTRCSTVVAIDRAGVGVMIERRFDADGVGFGETRVGFRWG